MPVQTRLDISVLVGSLLFQSRLGRYAGRVDPLELNSEFLERAPQGFAHQRMASKRSAEVAGAR